MEWKRKPRDLVESVHVITVPLRKSGRKGIILRRVTLENQKVNFKGRNTESVSEEPLLDLMDSVLEEFMDSLVIL